MAKHTPARLARRHPGSLQIRHPEAKVLFADPRRFAEKWTYWFLATALAGVSPPDPAEFA